MHRRLNPDLFDPSSSSVESTESNYSVVASRKLESELKDTKKRVSHLESLIEVMQSQMAVMNRNGEQRTEVFSKALSGLEQEFREESLARSRQAKHVEERFRDQRMKDSQMEAIVDRFNSTLVQFENKLSVLQRVLSEKEMTLVTYRRIIEQIVDEVEKLKVRPMPRRDL